MQDWGFWVFALSPDNPGKLNRLNESSADAGVVWVWMVWLACNSVVLCAQTDVKTDRGRQRGLVFGVVGYI